jgi:ribosomal protein S18 acetylase RimI-like enzyme
MADVTIREATVEDVSGVQQVARAGWTAAYDDILRTETIERAMEEWYATESVSGQIEREDVGYFVAEDGSAVVGYVTGGPGESEDTAVLGAIYVDPDRWGEGIGSRLLERFEGFSREEGYEAVFFEVLVGNEVGASFYRKHGYSADERRESDLFDEPVEAYLFSGELD